MTDSGGARNARVVETESLWDALYLSTYDRPWHVGVEPRETRRTRRDDGMFGPNEPRLAIKSGIYTVLTVGDYYDGGVDEQELALRAICEAVNAAMTCSCEKSSARLIGDEAFCNTCHKRVAERPARPVGRAT